MCCYPCAPIAEYLLKYSKGVGWGGIKYPKPKVSFCLLSLLTEGFIKDFLRALRLGYVKVETVRVKKHKTLQQSCDVCMRLFELPIGNRLEIQP